MAALVESDARANANIADCGIPPGTSSSPGDLRHQVPSMKLLSRKGKEAGTSAKHDRGAADGEAGEKLESGWPEMSELLHELAAERDEPGFCATFRPGGPGSEMRQLRSLVSRLSAPGQLFA